MSSAAEGCLNHGSIWYPSWPETISSASLGTQFVEILRRLFEGLFIMFIAFHFLATLTLAIWWISLDKTNRKKLSYP
jgi:hypothetical protein